jgi:hypothetical protein
MSRSCTALVSQFNELLAQIGSTLPRGPFEPPTLAIARSAGSLLGSTVSAPSAPTASDVVIRAPSFVNPCAPVSCELALSGFYAASCPCDADASLAALSFHGDVTGRFVLAGIPSAPIPPTAIQLDATSRCVRFTFAVPVRANKETGTDPHGSVAERDHFLIEGASVAGVAVPASELPLSVLFTVPMRAPQVLRGASGTYSFAAVSERGRVYSPKGAAEVLVFEPDGTPLPSLSLASSKNGAAVDEATQTLLLTEHNYGSPATLDALDLNTGLKRWSKSDVGGFGIGVLRKSGLVACASTSGNAVRVHRILDGEMVATIKVDYPINVAVDPVTDEIIAAGARDVFSVVWTGKELEHKGKIDAAGEGSNQRLVTVVPPALHKRRSHLVAAVFGTPTLRIVSLPDHTLICEHTFAPRLSIVGLAAAPTGTALLLSCGGDLHVFSWPLPGMPELE